VVIDGCGALASVFAPYLAGAGVGQLALRGDGATAVADTVASIAPDTVVTMGDEALDGDVVVAADRSLAELDRIAALGVPVVAGGLTPGGGWLVVAAARPPCIACVARQAGVEPAPTAPAAAAGVVGSLLSLAVIKLLLGLGPPTAPRWLLFDAAASTLEPQSFVPARDCRLCAAA